MLIKRMQTSLNPREVSGADKANITNKTRAANMASTTSTTCKLVLSFTTFVLFCFMCCGMCACGNSDMQSQKTNDQNQSENSQDQDADTQKQTFDSAVSDKVMSAEEQAARDAQAQREEEAKRQAEIASAQSATSAVSADVNALRASLNLSEDYRASFVHGEKPASSQKYIMLHDTEGNNDAASVISGWDGAGSGVAAHFIVNKDGSIYQCVPLDKIAHHAGFGNTGNNATFGVEDESRDDKVGTTSIGSAYADYGMNSYSVGIEIVHVGGSGDYPAAQLDALDKLIAYIDAYYGFQSQITDHKAWRTTNSDTSEEFSTYLANYKATRKH